MRHLHAFSTLVVADFPQLVGICLALVQDQRALPSYQYHKAFWAPQHRIDMTSGKTNDEKKNEEQDMGGKYALFRGAVTGMPRLFCRDTFAGQPVSSFLLNQPPAS
ncbi:MAG TPA: hypothetical protein VK901_19490 [Nitrospiraceae bacterium]|nr:hypothetical protein [Nitrospiraceae bacterium]